MRGLPVGARRTTGYLPPSKFSGESEFSICFKFWDQDHVGIKDSNTMHSRFLYLLFEFPWYPSTRLSWDVTPRPELGWQCSVVFSKSHGHIYNMLHPNGSQDSNTCRTGSNCVKESNIFTKFRWFESETSITISGMSKRDLGWCGSNRSFDVDRSRYQNFVQAPNNHDFTSLQSHLSRFKFTPKSYDTQFILCIFLSP